MLAAATQRGQSGRLPPMSADVAAVVLAAGNGRRMGGTNKALLDLAGEAVLAHSLRSLRACPSVADLTVVMNPVDCEELQRRWRTTPAALGADRVVEGGDQRWLSSRNGCTAADAGCALLLVHDGARPLVQQATIEAVAAAAREHGAALAAEPLADTLKREDRGGRIAATLPRDGLWRAQTPQVFRRELLLAAFAAWPPHRGLPTDEAMLLEDSAEGVMLVPAPSSNLKLTTPQDLLLAEALLAQDALS